MKRENLLQRLGLGLLLLVFAASAVHLATRTRRAATPGIVTLRFSHWQLEGGLREAYAAVAERYMALHPNVRVEQMPIPERVYGSWMRTQLVGGTAPDLIEFGQLPMDVMDELLARNFLPLTAVVEKPNPYNRGTPLENVAWRETFVDGLDTGYRTSNLREYYKIPTAMFTARIYYNRDLWRELLGDTPEPRTFAEFTAIARRVQAAPPVAGVPLVALAGAFRNSWVMLDRVFGSQMQRMSLQIDADHNLTVANTEVAVGWLRRTWGADSPEFSRGLELARDLIGTMSPGFVQQTRDDAVFLFLQRRALMVIAGSWDYTSLNGQADFPLGVFPLPLPARSDPVYGPAMLGEMNEAEAGAESAFALNAAGAHPEVALDFLHFITSAEGNRLFGEKSRWLPAVTGIVPPENLRPLMPVTEGYPNGFNARLLANLGFDIRRLWENNLGLLGAPTDGVGQVRAIYREQLPAALKADLLRLIAALRANVARQDTTIAALTGVMHGDSTAERDRVETKRSDIFRQQNAREAEAYWAEAELAAAAKSAP